MPSTVAEFLVVEKNQDDSFIVSKTLLRKFPAAMIHECVDSDVAVESLLGKPISAIVVHRALDAEGVDVVKKLRAVNPTVPLVFLSGNAQRGHEAVAAGATRFLPADEWLLVGTVVGELCPGLK